MRRNKKLKLDLTGQKFGDLSVVTWTKFKNLHRVWMCKCSCGKEHEVLGTHLVSGLTKSCGCKNHKSKSDSPCWTGYGDISGGMFSGIKLRAKKYNIIFNITIEYIWNLFLEQKKKCALSGIEITMPEKSGSRPTASLDRIDSSKGYIEGNVQWVHKDVNWMKNSFNQDYFIFICKQIANNNTI
jgi:hypothetical protein